MPQNMLESEMIGAIKIKDGLFIGDELASTVSHTPIHLQTAFLNKILLLSLKSIVLNLRFISSSQRKIVKFIILSRKSS